MRYILGIFSVAWALCFRGESFAQMVPYDISNDARDTAVYLPGQNSSESMITDVVPYSLTPDWSLNLRMQVGGIAVGDLDGDGDMDVAVGCYHSQSYPPYPDWRNFIVYNINGQLQSSPGWWSVDSASTTDIKIADFNNDGYPDIYCGNGDFTFTPDAIYFGQSNGTISPQPGWTANNSTWTTGVAVCDFDQDGDQDVATSNQGASPDPYRYVHIYVNRGGVLERIPSWNSSAQEISSAVAWGDYDNDGWWDLAVSKWVNFRSCVYRNENGIVNPVPVWVGNTTQGQKGIGWGDVNGDGFPELAISGSIPTQIYANDAGLLATQPFWQSSNSSHSTQELAWADIDYDGDPDLATVDFSTGHLRIYLNRDGQFSPTPSWQYDFSGSGTALGFGDIDGDGYVDLLMGTSGQPCLLLFLNNLTAVEDGAVPHRQQLHLCASPNPFNARTTITFSLEEDGPANISVYDLGGRLVRRLFSGQLERGPQRVFWDGADEGDHPLPSGIYFIQLSVRQNTECVKLTLVK